MVAETVWVVMSWAPDDFEIDGIYATDEALLAAWPRFIIDGDTAATPRGKGSPWYGQQATRYPVHS